MFYVWSNGEAYSNHWIAFIESDLDTELVKRFLQSIPLADGADRDAGLLFSSDKVELYNGATLSLIDFWTRHINTYHGPVLDEPWDDSDEAFKQQIHAFVDAARKLELEPVWWYDDWAAEQQEEERAKHGQE